MENLEKLVIIDKSKIDFCENKNGKTNFYYDNFYWCNNNDKGFYCWTCHGWDKKIKIGIVSKQDNFYIYNDFEHSKNCLDSIKKIKIIKEFINNYKKEDSKYREYINLFKTKINDGKIPKNKLKLAEKAEKMLKINYDKIFKNKRCKIVDHYEIMAKIIQELNKLKD